MNKENISNRVDKLETAVNAAASGVLNLEEQLKLADKRQQELAAKQVDMEAVEKQQQAEIEALKLWKEEGDFYREVGGYIHDDLISVKKDVSIIKEDTKNTKRDCHETKEEVKELKAQIQILKDWVIPNPFKKPGSFFMRAIVYPYKATHPKYERMKNGLFLMIILFVLASFVAVSGIISNSRLKKDQAELMLLKWKYPELLVPEIQLLDSLYEVDGDIDIKESFIHSNK